MHSMDVRVGGILLHPTSLPGPDGIGDLGSGVERWLAWLQAAGCRAWQMLPLGPVGYGNSPYQALSAFAGNPLLISLDRLVGEGLLDESQLSQRPSFPSDAVDYGHVIQHKQHWLLQAYRDFNKGQGALLTQAFEEFCQANAYWLEEYALFISLKAAHEDRAWVEWEPDLAQRDPAAIEKARKTFADQINQHRFQQFLFFRQWAQARQNAQAAGIELIGDIPIFVAHDSADVWAHPDLFKLDSSGQPRVVAGVPPDYFSETGQRWGNPLYRWDRMQAQGYEWWIRRLRSDLRLVDLVRLDHFRGFEAYWEIPASAKTAVEGRWVEGPGADFLQQVQSKLGELPLIAEDLGIITPQVEALRDAFNLPGMKVLQFAFESDPHHEFLPHTYPRRCVAYTGTHDNDTTLGWYQSALEATRDFVRRYLGVDGAEIAWDLIRAAWSSPAQRALAPLQDVLSLGSEARMNYPSRAHGNWAWRVQADQLTQSLADRLHEYNWLYGRLPPAPEDD